MIGLFENTEIWTPKGYVDSFEKYKNLSNKQSSEKLGYPAYVQPIYSESYGTLLSKYGHIWGENIKPTNDDCGQIFRKIQCSQNSAHHPSFRHVRCNDPGCPICYVKFAARLSDSTTERIQGYKSVWKSERAYHLIFWGRRADQPYADLRAAFTEAKRLLIIMGAMSSVVWYHPYRIKKEIKEELRRYRRTKGLDGKIGFWKMAHDNVLNLRGLEDYIIPGPHWHAIAFGWLLESNKFNELTGGGYKKKRYLDNERDVHETAHYISTHCCREYGKSSVRYYGNISYRMLAREMVESKIKDVLCNDCGSNLEEWEVDDKGDYYRETNNGVPTRKLKDKITEKIKYYLYWKKGQLKPEYNPEKERVFGKDQCLISRFCSR